MLRPLTTRRASRAPKGSIERGYKTCNSAPCSRYGATFTVDCEALKTALTCKDVHGHTVDKERSDRLLIPIVAYPPSLISNATRARCADLLTTTCANGLLIPSRQDAGASHRMTAVAAPHVTDATRARQWGCRPVPLAPPQYRRRPLPSLPALQGYSRCGHAPLYSPSA